MLGPSRFPPNPRDQVHRLNKRPAIVTSSPGGANTISNGAAHLFYGDGAATSLSSSSSISGVVDNNSDNASQSGIASVTSTYRHHSAGAFMPQTPAEPRPVLVKDSEHKPKTTGSFGILTVGIGGAKGTSLLAGILANRHGIEWHGPQGQPRVPDYSGCITQISNPDKRNQHWRGSDAGVAVLDDKHKTSYCYRDRVRGLADASLAAVGGWDVRPEKPGDRLLQHQILDFDLVRQVKDEMNKVKVFRGVYDSRFIINDKYGANRNTRKNDLVSASHVLSEDEAPTDSEVLKCLRADIRYFKWRNGLVGHTTVIWSAGVESDCGTLSTLKTADGLLDAIEQSEDERGGPLPPSLLYATAALLEGCSFVNGDGCENTVSCPGLLDLARHQTGVYCLGSGFRTGPMQYSAAVLEYFRTTGLIPRVVATSGNVPDGQELQSHTVDQMRNMFCNEPSNLNKQSKSENGNCFIQFKSHGFLGHQYTMVTHTTSSETLMCVPLMIDCAVWCDFFSSRSWPDVKVSEALAYLFENLDEEHSKAGFFQQMQQLDTQVVAAYNSRSSGKGEISAKKRVRIRAEEKATEWAIPHDARVVCSGLACVDMQLNHATGGDGGEGIETFEGIKNVAGGSVSMACKTLARLCHGAPLDDGFMQVTPPVVHSVVPLCKVGNDTTGDTLISLLEDCGVACRNVETKYCKAARSKGSKCRTALAVLPIYQNGRRGCFIDAHSNDIFSAKDLTEMIGTLSSGSTGPVLDTSQMSPDDIEIYKADLESMTPIYGAFVFGYPHLLPKMQGESLALILLEARSVMIEGGIIAVDLNGVPEGTFDTQRGGLRSVMSLKHDSVIGSALEHIDILHMNEDELMLLTGCEVKGTPESQLEDDYAIASAVNLFLLCGVAVVAVTRGDKGSYVSCNDADRFRRTSNLPSSWIDLTAKVSCVQLPPKTVINSNGAGDAFTAGLLVAAMLRHTGMTVKSKTVNAKLDGMKQRTVKEAKSHDGHNQNMKKGSRSKAKLTPYTLYMQENYMTLKNKYKDDKKAIFSMCHEMWENESDEVKAFYERKAVKEDEDIDPSKGSSSVLNDLETLDSTKNLDSLHYHAQDENCNLYMANRSLNLETAVQFASLVAAYHVDVVTRDRKHIDVSSLLERAMVFRSVLEEI